MTLLPKSSEDRNLHLKLYIVVYGLLLLVTHQFVHQIPQVVQWIVFAGTMLFTGIPHGAIDHLVEEQNQARHNKRFSLLSFLTKYLSRMLLYGLMWWFFPLLALLVFIGISAYHFGETDLVVLPKHTKSEKPLFLGYGWLLISVLLISHLGEVLPILQSLPRFSGSTLETAIARVNLNLTLYYAFCSFLFTGSLLYYCWQSKAALRPIAIILFQGALLLFICIKLPLLLAFSFYFGLWHSLLCLQSIRQHLTQNGQLLAWNQLVRKAVLFSVIAIFGIVALIVLGNRYSQTEDLLLGLFIGIAILTAPHMEVMSTMFSEIRAGQANAKSGKLAV